MIRALLVDDEPLVRERLRSLLGQHDDIEVVGESGDGLAALDALEAYQPDVAFLDIQMPGLTGLEVAEAWRSSERMPVVVFVTAFDQYALDAFRLHALDYLTKPIDPDRFDETLQRVRGTLTQSTRADLDQRLQAMLEYHERRQAARPHLVVREQDRYLLVPTREIQALEATGNYVCLHTERGQHILRGTLGSVAAKLDPHKFLRTHRSWIVNLDHVREAQPWSKGTWILLTRSGLKIPVGQQHRDVLSRLLD